MQKLIISGNEQIDNLLEDISHSQSISMDRSALALFLQRYIDDYISPESIVSLSNALEINENLNQDELKDAMINDILFRLANPDINENITKDTASSIIALLGR